MIPRDMAPEDLIAMAAHLGDLHSFRIERKDRSELMSLCGQVLEWLGIQSRETFCGNYCTTIPDVSGEKGACIYLTFDLGIDTAWPLRAQHDVLLHEAEHALQIQQDGALAFAAKYLCDRSARTLYECQCYGQRYELAQLRGEPMPSVEDVASHLRAYGLGQVHLEEAAAIAGSLRRSALAGGVGSQLVREASAWWKGRRR